MCEVSHAVGAPRALFMESATESAQPDPQVGAEPDKTGGFDSLEGPARNAESGSAQPIDVAVDAPERLSTLMTGYMVGHGIIQPPEPRDEGPNAERHRQFDASIGRIHLVSAAGVGLGVAGTFCSTALSTVASLGAVATDIVEGVAGAFGFVSYGLSHSFLLRWAYPKDKEVGETAWKAPGYGQGIASVALPTSLCACLGFALYETHATSCLGAIVAGTVSLGTYHYWRFRHFER